MQVSDLEHAAVVTQLRAAGCVFAEAEAALLAETATTAGELDRLVDQRAGGLPLEQVVGWAEFCGLRVTVAPRVFVPRRRSELLVREAIRITPRGGVVLDLCCGSGAIGAAIMAARPDVCVHASDIAPEAVDCARRNLPTARSRVYRGDLYDALPLQLQGTIDVLVANAPYVPSAAIAWMPPEARDHEPLVALDGGVDGLDLHRRIAARALQWLAPDGHILIEAGLEQAPITARYLTEAGLDSHVVHDGEIDGTVVAGSRRGRREPNGKIVTLRPPMA